MKKLVFDGRYEFDTVSGELRSMSTQHFGRVVEKRYSGGQQGWYLTTHTGARPLFHTVTRIRNMTGSSQPNSLVQAATAAPSASGKFIIGSRVGAKMSISNEPKIHTDVNAAKQEAERLARLDPAKVFVVLAIVGEVQVQGLAWR